MIESLPYELIGKVVVAIIALIMAVFILIGIPILLYKIWFKSLTFLSNLIWRNYEPKEGERPPKNWRKVSAFIIILRDNDFQKKEEVWEEIENRS